MAEQEIWVYCNGKGRVTKAVCKNGCAHIYNDTCTCTCHFRMQERERNKRYYKTKHGRIIVQRYYKHNAERISLRNQKPRIKAHKRRYMKLYMRKYNKVKLKSTFKNLITKRSEYEKKERPLSSPSLKRGAD
jgi:hypothetical protein